MTNRKLVLIGSFLLFTALLVSKAFADDAKYAATYVKPLRSQSLKDPLSRILAAPFELIRWPTSKSLYITEKEYLHKKTEWVYDYLKTHGIHPSFGTASGYGFFAGLKLDLPKLTGVRTKYPDLIFDTWIHYGNEINFQVGTEIGAERIADTPFFSTLFFQYEDRWEERFFGVGPDTSRGDGTTYGLETTTLAWNAGYEFSPSTKAAGHVIYRNNNVSEGESDDFGQINRFPNLAGTQGDDILSLVSDLTHDTRDYADAPTKGGFQKVVFGYNEGVKSSKARYFTYSAEAGHYFKLGSTRRILALHAQLEHRDEINGGYVPFYDMSKLGGYGAPPEVSRALRGYGANRFYDESLMLFNIEYRYAIWEYREIQLDAVPFFDLGQVFGEFSDMQFKDFRESYGVDFRLYVARSNFLNLSFAHGDEGTQIVFRSKKAF